jgi:choline dehydrogenase-like flavoprotein
VSEPDIIVIGGGSAGAAMAGRLAAAAVKVTLVEAGASDQHYRSRIPALTSSIVQNAQFDWCYKVEPDESLGGRADIWPAGKLLGGGSALNGMMFIRGHRWDYDHWAELGAAGWDYRSVLPYFRRMEDNERGADEWRGTGGPIAVSEGRARYPITDAWIAAAQSTGLERRDLNGEKAEGVDYVQVSQRQGERCSSARGYLREFKSGTPPQILLNAQVLRILVEEGRAVGIAYLQDGAEKTLRAKRGVVLSAGAMNTPRLLMLSGIGPAEHLAEMGVPVVRDLAGVGRNLQDHVGTHVVNEVSALTLNDEARGVRGALSVLRYALGRRGALSTSIGHAQAFVRSRPGLPAPNLQISFAAFAFDFDEQGRLMLRQGASVSTLVGLMRPAYRGRITLRSADPLAPPVIQHQQLSCDDDIDQIAEGIEIARGILERDPVAPYIKSELRPGAALKTKEELRGYVRMAAIPMYHPVGTARIGAPDDPMAVVDPDLKVIGMEGLWVADASVFPSLPAGNTNATAIMVGDKGSDHVLKALRINSEASALAMSH